MNRTDLRGESLCGEIKHLRADQIGWHQIRRALYALERTRHGGGQGLSSRGLGKTRHRFDENMAAGHQRGDQGFAQILLADQGLGESGANQRTQFFRAVDVFCG